MLVLNGYSVRKEKVTILSQGHGFTNRERPKTNMCLLLSDKGVERLSEYLQLMHDSVYNRDQRKSVECI